MVVVSVVGGVVGKGGVVSISSRGTQTKLLLLGFGKNHPLGGVVGVVIGWSVSTQDTSTILAEHCVWVDVLATLGPLIEVVTTMGIATSDVSMVMDTDGLEIVVVGTIAMGTIVDDSRIVMAMVIDDGVTDTSTGCAEVDGAISAMAGDVGEGERDEAVLGRTSVPSLSVSL